MVPGDGGALDEGVRGEENRLRADEVVACEGEDLEELMASVPQVENELVRVPKIRADEEG